MTVGELFINLGIKGADKAAKEVGSVKESMGGLIDSSLAAKAAIIAVVYELEHMMSQSAKTGTSLKDFSLLTGISATTLQHWQNAGRKAGESAEDMMQNFKGVQSTMTQMLTGGGQPSGMAMLAAKVGFDPSKAKDTAYVMQQLVKYIQAEKDVALANKQAKSFGVSESFIAAAREGVFTKKNLQTGEIYSDRETEKLKKVDVAWNELGHKVQMAMGHLTAKHGLPVVEQISMLTDQVFKLLEAFNKLAESLKVFRIIGQIFEGWGLIFEGINNTIKDMTNKQQRFEKNPNAAEFKSTGIFKNQLDWLNKKILPPVKVPAANSTNTNATANTTVHIHGVKDAHQATDHMKREIKHSVRTLAAQNQGS